MPILLTDAKQIVSTVFKRQGLNKVLTNIYTESVDQSGNFVSVRLRYMGVDYIGYSKCCPKDDFNLGTGIKIAAARAAYRIIKTYIPDYNKNHAKHAE